MFLDLGSQFWGSRFGVSNHLYCISWMHFDNNNKILKNTLFGVQTQYYVNSIIDEKVNELCSKPRVLGGLNNFACGTYYKDKKF